MFSVEHANLDEPLVSFMSDEGKRIIREHGGLECVLVVGELWPPYLIHASVWAKRGSWQDHGTILDVPDSIK